MITPNLIPLTPPQHIGKYQDDAINSIAPQILTNEMIQEYQTLDNTLYPDEIDPEPAAISIITIPILVKNTSTPQLPIPLPKASNTPILQTFDNLTV